MRSLFVTGGSGFLGSEVVRQARAAGWDVTAPPRAALDVRDAGAVADALKGAGSSAVVHTAYRFAGDDARAITEGGTASVARAAKTTGARLLHLSTDLVFDGTLTRAYREDDAPNPIVPYGDAKLASERAALEAPNALVVRTSLLYGKDEPNNHERIVVDALAGRADVAFFTDEIRCPTHVADLAAALLELAVSDVTGVLHVTGPEALSRHEFARRIALGRGLDPSGLRSATSEGLGRPQRCALDTTRARAILRTPLRAL